MPVAVALRVPETDGQLRGGHAPPTASAAATATAATRLPSHSSADDGHADVVPGTVAAAQCGNVAVARQDTTVAAHVTHTHAGPPTCHHAGSGSVQPVPSLLRQRSADAPIAATSPIAAYAAVPDTPIGCGTREFPDAVTRLTVALVLVFAQL